VVKRTSRWLSASAAALIASAALGSHAPAVSAADQLQESAISTYELRPDRGVVHVTIQLTLTNRAPSTSRSWDCSYVALDPYGYPYSVSARCTRRTDYYYDSYEFWVERDAKAFKAKANTGSVSVRPSTRKGSWRTIKLGITPLYYGKTRKISFSYDLPAGGPRSTHERRVGYVYSRFCAVGPGTDTGRLRVVVPGGFAMLADVRISSTTAKGKTTFDSGNLKKNPWEFLPCFSGEDRKGYAVVKIPTATGHTTTIEAWKEDKTWAGAVATSVTEDLPALERLLGPMPGGDLRIHEQLGPSRYTQEAGTTIRYLSEFVSTRAAVTDDLTHIWVPSEVLRGDWLAEGYTGWAQHQAGVSEAPCAKPDAGSAARRDLDRWVRLGSKPTQADRDAIAYQRQAACYLVSEIATAIGTERLVETLAGMRQEADPWRPTDAEAKRTSFDWRAWLDTMTERGYVPAGVDPSRLTDMLQEHGIADDAEELKARTEAHAAYHELAALMGERPVPKAVTDQLARWDFEAAGLALASTKRAWQDLASVSSKLPAVDVDGGEIQLAVLNATTQAELDAAADQAATQAKLATDVADAVAAQGASRDVLQSIGLVGVTFPDTAALVDAVARSDGAAASSGSATINASLASARDTGILRAALAAGALVILIALAWFTSRRLRRSSQSSPAGDE
jgi:hypothetical protein